MKTREVLGKNQFSEECVVPAGDREKDLLRTIAELSRREAELCSLVENKDRKLNTALIELENMQAQLIQSEKMASLGQLAAGVAHEINNPTGFISSNLKTLGDYQKDLNKLLVQYQKFMDEVKSASDAVPEQAWMSMASEIEAIEEDIDIDFLQDDIADLIGECREGTDRIKKIVDDLKHFAHPGQDKVQDTDLNRELESTLNVVNNELKYKAKVIKELNPLPIIKANPQQLNQVFVNILVNAAQAIEKCGEIRIKTRHIRNNVQVDISDTGCGIAEENLTKIFDLFYTTKAVGKGTGLGMHIAYNIVKKHQGDIRVQSCVGEGTTFTICLPVCDVVN
jgi:two-component system, NtrC family, sensor kinase